MDYRAPEFPTAGRPSDPWGTMNEARERNKLEN